MALNNKRDAAIQTMPRDGMNIIDTDRYPLDQPDSDVLQEMIVQARAGLEMDGCARAVRLHPASRPCRARV